MASVVFVLYRIAPDSVCDQGREGEAFLNHVNPSCGPFSNSALISVSKTPWPSWSRCPTSPSKGRFGVWPQTQAPKPLGAPKSVFFEKVWGQFQQTMSQSWEEMPVQKQGRRASVGLCGWLFLRHNQNKREGGRRCRNHQQPKSSFERGSVPQKPSKINALPSSLWDLKEF